MKTRIIMVGGFLGAGKTTLLWEAARRITEKDKRVGLITNDQASALVDTAFLEKANGVVSEVSGSCFCCNFNGLTDAISQMRSRNNVEVIIAEPVGSCTDLSATLLQPLKEKYKEDLEMAPLSVLVDPKRLADILQGGNAGLHESAAYIINKQTEEADIIVINKIDLLTADEVNALKEKCAEKWPKAKIHAISAKNGDGLEDWLTDVMTLNEAGTHLAEVDYDIYAEGEAVLGWLNTTVELKGKSAETDWNAFAQNLMSNLASRFDDLNASVGHVKMLLEAGDKFVIGNLTGTKDTLSIRGSVDPGKSASMTLNARVQMDPDTLKNIVGEELQSACGSGIEMRIVELNYLSPGRPNPTYRYDRIV
ncbi:MAG TPA: GTP-binding protein [Bacillota bacterium]|jgi:G3E family GTPase|nr:cobalamin synthesis protein P47K [Clostridiales bacterium UBA9856]HOA42516.1 GTP-binding protein [Bacillota bacterium]HPZ59723.1 GTP-binding protein [Bacillota bacterium]HQC82400.1 GTP-binding protein [Bacillota bacterium]